LRLNPVTYPWLPLCPSLYLRPYQHLLLHLYLYCSLLLHLCLYRSLLLHMYMYLRPLLLLHMYLYVYLYLLGQRRGVWKGVVGDAAQP